MWMLLSGLAAAAELDCDNLHLTVEISQAGTLVQGADPLLFPDGRPSIREVPDMSCPQDVCEQPGDYNWAGLERSLARVQQACPAQDELVLVPRGETRFDVVVEAARVAQRVFPRTILGGGAIGMGEGGRGVEVVKLKPGVALVGGTVLNEGVAPGDFDRGGSNTDLRVEATADLPYIQLAEVIRSAGKMGYQTYTLSVVGGGSVTTVAPRKGVAKPVVKASLSQQEVLAGVQGILEPINTCYQAALERDSNTRGQITVAFTVQPDGSVREPRTQATTIYDPELEACVNEAFLGATFEAPGGEVQTTFPLTLNPF